MTVEYIYHCEGPGCEMRQQSMAFAPLPGWLQVHEGHGSLPDVTLDFCGWDCCLRFASKIEPSETVQVEQ